VPFNIASYALLTEMVAAVCSLSPGEFIHTFGDIHIYRNHLEQVHEQLSRSPRRLPVLRFGSVPDRLQNFRYEDIQLIGYDPCPTIRAPIAV
jgi:thymidylate synthase